jgi:hypothetical protein
MTTKEIQREILTLQTALAECILSDSQRVAIRNELGQLQDELSLREFDEQPDIDWGFHSEWE